MTELDATLLLSKIVSLSDARRGLMSSKRTNRPDHDPEQRREFRRASSERLFAQVTQSDDKDLVGTTLSCQAMDASAGGLKIFTDQFLSVGCVLDLWIDDSRKPGKFFLSCDVRWVDEGEHMFGVQLRGGSATDIDEWRERHG